MERANLNNYCSYCDADLDPTDSCDVCDRCYQLSSKLRYIPIQALGKILKDVCKDYSILELATTLLNNEPEEKDLPF